MLFHTIPDILSYANEAYGADDAIRWKKSKNEIESRTYSELKNDTDSFANAIEKLGKKGQHIAVIGPSSYEWMYPIWQSQKAEVLRFQSMHRFRQRIYVSFWTEPM